jgi:hypothetical protein
VLEQNSSMKSRLTRISHTFSDSSHTLHDDLASQVGEAVLHEHCPRPLERQSQSAERRSVQKKCEKCGLIDMKMDVAAGGDFAFFICAGGFDYNGELADQVFCFRLELVRT